eukprot:CAMPEP_0119214856 /NCGR_PEP_ID=MMETSP1327-20130426/10665_1 /TAXON_ID=38833 /ORGANISM="Micromonas pusilla, Strain RCC2306" /LENGTH=37 /DNA_ID=CAMNT_0007212621 /DNA_START=484 /DNA_END=597 /DNA_ORIENTATION=+
MSPRAKFNSRVAVRSRSTYAVSPDDDCARDGTSRVKS